MSLARTRPGRLLYQRLLLPLDASRLARAEGAIERILTLDSYTPLVHLPRRFRYGALVHDVLPLTHPRYWSPAERLVKRVAFASLSRGPVKLFTSSDFNASQIQRVLGTEAMVVQFGCGQLSDREADEAAARALPERQPYLLYVGAIEPRKETLFLLDVFEQLLTRAVDLRLVIAGHGREPYLGAVKRRAAGVGDPSRIEFVQDAGRGQLLRLIAHGAALVLPSRAEGFGLTALEAMALGTPVVATDLPAIRSWAGDAVLYAAVDKPREWVDAIIAAIDSDDQRRRLGQTAARAYRWCGCAEALTDF